MMPAPADVLLFRGKSTYSRLIRLAQGCPLTHPDGRFAEFTHAAMIVAPDPHGWHLIVEATGTGVRERRMGIRDCNPAPSLVPIRADATGRARAVAFARYQARQAAPYDLLDIASIGLTLLTGSDLILRRDGKWICSELVSAALIRAGYEFPRDPSRISPADLADYLHVIPPERNL